MNFFMEKNIGSLLLQLLKYNFKGLFSFFHDRDKFIHKLVIMLTATSKVNLSLLNSFG